MLAKILQVLANLKLRSNKKRSFRNYFWVVFSIKKVSQTLM